MRGFRDCMHFIFNIGKAGQSSLVVIGFSLFVTSTTWNDRAIFVDAQTTSSLSTPTIQITSHRDGQRVPQGELTLKGISSDNDETDCQVYADVNDMTPMRNVTGQRVLLEIQRTFRIGLLHILIYIS